MHSTAVTSRALTLIPPPNTHSTNTQTRYFNTNNLWVNLPALKATLNAANGVLPLPLIKNKKTVNPRDSSSEPVFQLETAMGSGEC